MAKGRFLKGNKPWNYKGEGSSYSAVHHWIRNHFGKADHCDACHGTERTCENRKPAGFEWANKSGKYLYNIDDWEQLCTVCHRHRDGNVERILQEAPLANRKIPWQKVYELRKKKLWSCQKIADELGFTQGAISWVLKNKFPPVECKCQLCEKKFQPKKLAAAKWCSRACQSRAQRQRRHLGQLPHSPTNPDDSGVL